MLFRIPGHHALAVADAAAGGAAAAVAGKAAEAVVDAAKKDDRPLPPQQPAAAKEKPPELAADALSQISNRVSALEKAGPPGPGKVLIVVGVALAVVLGIVAIIVRIVRGSSGPTQEK